MPMRRSLFIRMKKMNRTEDNEGNRGAKTGISEAIREDRFFVSSRVATFDSHWGETKDRVPLIEGSINGLHAATPPQVAKQPELPSTDFVGFVAFCLFCSSVFPHTSSLRPLVVTS